MPRHRCRGGVHGGIGRQRQTSPVQVVVRAAIPEVLPQATIDDETLIFIDGHIASIEQSVEIVDLVRAHFPQAEIIARARNVAHYYQLRDRNVAHIEREVFDSLLAGLDHHVSHSRLEWWREECERAAGGRALHPLTQALVSALGGAPVMSGEPAFALA